MILTESEIPDFAPQVKLQGKPLEAAIALIQSIMEGTRGTNRKLELQKYSRIYRINLSLQSFRIQEFPLVDILKVQGRVGNEKSRFGEAIATSEWQDIQDNEYLLDREDNRITINISPTDGFGRTNSRFTEIKVDFNSGFDFTDTDNTEVLILKAIAGQILDYHVNNIMNKGISSVDVVGEQKVSYASNSGGSGRVGASIGQVPDSMLENLKQYRIINGAGFRG